LKIWQEGGIKHGFQYKYYTILHIGFFLWLIKPKLHAEMRSL
jgi:hypothetical protein